MTDIDDAFRKEMSEDESHELTSSEQPQEMPQYTGRSSGLPGIALQANAVWYHHIPNRRVTPAYAAIRHVPRFGQEKTVLVEQGKLLLMEKYTVPHCSKETIALGVVVDELYRVPRPSKKDLWTKVRKVKEGQDATIESLVKSAKMPSYYITIW